MGGWVRFSNWGFRVLRGSIFRSGNLFVTPLSLFDWWVLAVAVLYLKCVAGLLGCLESTASCLLLLSIVLESVSLEGAVVRWFCLFFVFFVFFFCRCRSCSFDDPLCFSYKV